MRSLYGNSMELIGKSLDYLWLKQSVTLNNIANSDTVGFKADYVTFEDEFKRLLDEAAQNGKSSDIQNAISTSQIELKKSEAEGLRLDGNNVNVDVEMVELTRTSLQYQYAANSLTSDIARLRTAIKGQ